MRRLGHLTLAAAVALAVAASAGASTIRLNWVEKLDKGPAVRLTFRVGTLQTTGKTWAATVEIVNRGTGKVGVSGAQFGVLEFATKTDFERPLRFLRAATLKPPLPAVLAPGKAWRGTIGGPGTPDDSRHVRLVFGPFTSGLSPTPFTWITDHEQHRFTIAI